jgi:DNA-binding MarR family transcriptional regulator
MQNKHDALERLFHEPHRLAVMGELCGAGMGLSFSELKQRCGLTDGNLSRHLQALERAGAVRIEKTFVGSKPRTTAFVTESGREDFLNYLQALEDILRQTAAKIQSSEQVIKKMPAIAKPSKA